MVLASLHRLLAQFDSKKIRAAASLFEPLLAGLDHWEMLLGREVTWRCKVRSDARFRLTQIERDMLFLLDLTLHM